MKPAKGKTTLHYKKRPSPQASLFHAFSGISFSFDENEFEPLEALWSKAGTDKKHLKKYLDICNMTGDDYLPMFYPMTSIFALIMRVLGHKKAPLSVLRTLNTAETIHISRPIKIAEEPDIRCELCSYRYIENGLEVDIAGRVMVGGKTIFKTVKSFLYRGKFNGPVTPVHSLEKIVKGPVVARWILPGNVGFRFGFISGDTNPIHYLPRYARLQGFARDFAQPILVMETCLQKIKAAGLQNFLEPPYEIEIHYKGPVYYERENYLRYGESPDGHRFDIFCGDNTRPSIMFAIKKYDGIRHTHLE